MAPRMSPPPELAAPPPPAAPRPWREAALLCAVYFALLAAFPVKTPFDSMLTVPAALSLLREGNIDLDEYAPTLEGYRHGVHEQNGHRYNSFPLGPSLVAVPFLLLMDIAARAGEPLGALHPGLARAMERWRHDYDATGNIRLWVWDDTQRLIASVLVALAGAVMYAVGRQRLSRPRALLLATVFVFCTPALSTASRALWQHGPSMLCLSLVLLCLVKAQQRPAWAGWAGLPLALSYVMRPTNSISVLLLSGYVLWTHPRQALEFFAGAALVAVPWCAANLAHYGSLLAPYYEAGRLDTEAALFAEALAGNLVSPGRGLLVFTPLVWLSFWGVAMEIRAKSFTRLHGFLLAVVVVHWLTISTFPHWWAGHSYGPRFFTDMVPYLIFFLVPVVGALGWSGQSTRRPLTATFAVLALLSLAIHIHGASPARCTCGTAPPRTWTPARSGCGTGRISSSSGVAPDAVCESEVARPLETQDQRRPGPAPIARRAVAGTQRSPFPRSTGVAALGSAPHWRNSCQDSPHWAAKSIDPAP